jgi:hypothetical protein
MLAEASDPEKKDSMLLAASATWRASGSHQIMDDAGFC